MKIKSILYIVILVIMVSSNMKAQEIEVIEVISCGDTIRDIDSLIHSGIISIDKIADDSIFIFVEHMPEFPGGQLALRKFIAENLTYPPIARECAIQGTVFLRFVVTKTGEIGKIELQRGIDPLLDKEAVKVIKLLPNFIPGLQSGNKVNVWYSIPIKFVLN